MTRSEKEKQSYKLVNNRQTKKKKKLLGLRIYQLKTNGIYTAILGFFMSLGIEVTIHFMIIHKNV